MIYFCVDYSCLFMMGIYWLFRGGFLLYDLLGKGREYPPRIDLEKRAHKPLGTLLWLACSLGVVLGIRASGYVIVWVLVTFFWAD